MDGYGNQHGYLRAPDGTFTTLDIPGPEGFQDACATTPSSISSSAFGGAGASITAAKRRRLERAARHYLGYIGREPPCRFDAILLDALDSKRIEWLVDV